MTELHIAKLIQILGLLVGTGFGTILLNPEVVGQIANKINVRFLNIVNRLNKISQIAKIFLMPKEGFPKQLKWQLILSVLIFFAWILLLTSLILNIDFLFWVSVSFLGINIAWHITNVFLLPRTNRAKRYTPKLLLFLLIARLINVFLLFPIVDTLLLFFIRVVHLVVLILNSIAGKNRVRRGLIISGFILILAGMIWELFLIY
jgi:hypothetical protein